MTRTLICLGLGSAIAAAPFFADRTRPERLLAKDNLVAWCIVPFDAKKRGPEERAKMLATLGIKKLAYDWRDKDIPTFDQELDALNRHKIKLHAFWLTSGPKPQQDQNVSAVLGFLKRRNVNAELWYMFIPPEGFASMPDDVKIATAAEAVRFIASEALAFRGSVGLYNHGGWFGEPENQIAIIKKLGMNNIGLVYNFHHGKAHVERFSKLFPMMMPYVMAVNLNGMRDEGPQILPVGKGDLELDMVRVVLNSGYRGPIGILGHREDQDAEVSLRRNLEGVEMLKKALASGKSTGFHRDIQE